VSSLHIGTSLVHYISWWSLDDTRIFLTLPQTLLKQFDDCKFVVHFACRFNPPRSIIKRLASTYPAGICIPDETGRLPVRLLFALFSDILFHLLSKTMYSSFRLTF
jgi:hypothetical protein